MFEFDLETVFNVEHIVGGFGIESFILVEQCLIFAVAYRAAIDLRPKSMRLLPPLHILNLLLPFLPASSLAFFSNFGTFPFLLSLCLGIPGADGVRLRTCCNVLSEFLVKGVLLLLMEERNCRRSLASELSCMAEVFNSCWLAGREYVGFA